ncbi:hypothetical protein R6Q57_021401 [Mikania cordata]
MVSLPKTSFLLLIPKELKTSSPNSSWRLMVGEAKGARRAVDQRGHVVDTFKTAFLPSYRVITVEVSSTFTYRPVAVLEVVFCLLGQRHEMSLVEFTVVSGLYYEPKTVTSMYTTRIIELDDTTLGIWWHQIADDDFVSTKELAIRSMERDSQHAYQPKSSIGLSIASCND